MRLPKGEIVIEADTKEVHELSKQTIEIPVTVRRFVAMGKNGKHLQLKARTYLDRFARWTGTHSMRERYVDSVGFIEFKGWRCWLPVRVAWVWAMVEDGEVVFRRLDDGMGRIRVLRAERVRYGADWQPVEVDERVARRTDAARGVQRDQQYADALLECDRCGDVTYLFRQGLCRECWIDERGKAERGESDFFRKTRRGFLRVTPIEV